jgi:hypothetical protein
MVGGCSPKRHDYMITEMTEDHVPTLYEWAGGADAFERLTELFYRKIHADPVLAPVFAHVGPDHAHHVPPVAASPSYGPRHE